MASIASDSYIITLLREIVSQFLQLPILVQLTLPPLLCVVSWSAYNYLFRLRGVPGPLLVRLGVPGQLAWWAIKLEWVWRVEDLHKKYGPVVRIAPDQIDFCSASAVRQIYGHGSKYLKPKRFYDGFVVVKNRPSIFSDTDPHSHSARRRAVSAAYALNYLVKLEECVDPLVDLLIKRIYMSMKEIQDEKDCFFQTTLDMTKVLHFMAMDAVGELAFGKPFGLLEEFKDDKKFLRGVGNLSQWGGAIGYMPSSWGPLVRKAFKWMFNEPGGEVIAAATRDGINARYELLDQGKEPLREDMLCKFVQAKHENGTLFTKDQVLATSVSVIAAGSDTTAVSLSSIMRYLVGHPEAYQKLQQEVDEAFETVKLSEPCEYNSAVKLSYMQACIKETLRLHPPISMSLPRKVPPGGDIIDGHFYPGGTIVGVSPYILHRDTSIWGPDAAEFRPERWLDIDEEQRKHLERNFFSFGGGARQCIGKNISLMEITKTLPRLLWHFEFSAAPRQPSLHTLPGRSSTGQFSEREPWHISSSWFLNAEELYLNVTARRPDDRDAIIVT
ncbi:unnamed protein product [Sympodiomycopsis kandeliae]